MCHEVAIPELKAVANSHAATMEKEEYVFPWSGEGYTKKRGAIAFKGFVNVTAEPTHASPN